MKKFVICGAYTEGDGGLIATCEGIFDTREAALEKLEELFNEAEDYGLEETMNSEIYNKDTSLPLCDIYYEDGSYQHYAIREV